VPNLNIPAIYHKPHPETGAYPRGLADNAVHLDYLRHIKGIDENLGRLLDTLDELELAEDTVVVYTSDNGYFLGEHGCGDKRALYEESLLIPFLVRYPREFPKGLVCTTGVCDLTGSFDGSFAARSFDWGESFVIRILPFMDSQAVYDQYDFSRPNHWASNREVVSAPLPMLLCPSRDRVNTWGGRTKIHYGGNYGAGRAISETLSWPRTLRGVFDAARQWGASTAHITDGMSQTLLLGEIITDSRESDDSRGAWNFQGGTAFSGGLTVATPSDSHVYARMRGPNAVFTAADAGTKADQTAYCPNQRPQSDTTYYCLDGSYGVAVRSTHPGGVNVALADGSTRFAADSVDLLTWYRLHTIAGREVVGEW